MENYNNITEILTDDKKGFRVFDRYDMIIEETFNGSIYLEDNNGILNTFSTDDSFDKLDEWDREEILKTFDGVEVRVIAGLLYDNGENLMDAVNTLKENIILISDAWLESSYEFKSDVLNILEEYEILKNDDELLEEYMEEAYTLALEQAENKEDEEEVQYIMDEILNIMIEEYKTISVNDFIKYEADVIIMNQGLILKRII